MTREEIIKQIDKLFGDTSVEQKVTLDALEEIRSDLDSKISAIRQDLKSAGKLHEPIPEDHPVQPLTPGQPAEDRATCGYCGLSWDDAVVTSMTPTPSGRCPFEAYHVYE